MAPSSIAILGGGISGLSSAFYLARRFPKTPITLLEGRSRLGGWIESTPVAVELDDGSSVQVVLESGPRTLRTESPALLDLIDLVGLGTRLVVVPKDAPAARNRFLHEPGTPGLTKLPNRLLDIFSSPIGRTIAFAMLKDLATSPNRPPHLEDESVDEFLSRRMGPQFARLGSGLVHGVYAADSRELSVSAAFRRPWDMEGKHGGIVRSLIYERLGLGSLDAEKAGLEADLAALQATTHGKGDMMKQLADGHKIATARALAAAERAVPSPNKMGRLQKQLRNASVFTFDTGLQALPDAVAAALNSMPNVRLRTDVPVKALMPTPHGFELTTATNEIVTASHVISTLALPKLGALIPTNYRLPHLDRAANPLTSVLVVNLVFPAAAAALHPPGFGYLIPRSSAGYGDGSNPEGVLGVIFDSYAAAPEPGVHRMTVMLGGPHTTHATELDDVLRAVQRHLGLLAPLPAPLFARAVMQTRCIPTPLVGHPGRIAVLQAALCRPPWSSRLEVIGAAVGGVSVGKCVEAGRDVGALW